MQAANEGAASTGSDARSIGIRIDLTFEQDANAFVTALTNPKVGLFYIALLPQFVPAGTPLLPATLLLAGIQISLSCGWYLILATAVNRIRDAYARHRGRIQAATGALMIGFGLRLLTDR